MVYIIVFTVYLFLQGMILLWLTAIIPQLRPASCSPSGILCDSANPYQLAVLFSSLVFISIGAGCIRPCSVAFGADQLTKEEKPNNDSVLDSYFNWYYASIGIATIIALSLIVFIQDQFGWGIGFAVPAVLMLFSVLIFLVGSSLYVKVKPTQSLLTGFLRVIVVAFKNRKLSLPFSNFDQYYLGRDPKCPIPTDSMRYVSRDDAYHCYYDLMNIHITLLLRIMSWYLMHCLGIGLPVLYFVIFNELLLC